MIFFQSTLDLIIKAKDQAFEVAVRAEQESRTLIVAAKQDEIDALRAQVESLEAIHKYERSRADALVDRLLVRDASVSGVTTAAAAAVNAPVSQDDDEKRKIVAKIFDELGEMNGDIPASKESRAFEFAGKGSAVKRV